MANLKDELWVLQWGPFKGDTGNFHIDTIAGMLADNASAFQSMQVKNQINVQRIWMPIFIGTFEQCTEAANRFRKMGFSKDLNNGT